MGLRACTAVWQCIRIEARKYPQNVYCTTECLVPCDRKQRDTQHNLLGLDLAARRRLLEGIQRSGRERLAAALPFNHEPMRRNKSGYTSLLVERLLLLMGHPAQGKCAKFSLRRQVRALPAKLLHRQCPSACMDCRPYGTQENMAHAASAQVWWHVMGAMEQQVLAYLWLVFYYALQATLVLSAPVTPECVLLPEDVRDAAQCCSLLLPA